MAGVGAQLFQPPVTLINTSNGITQKYFQPILADSIFNPSPTYWRLTRMGKKVTGGALVWTIVTTEETTGGAYYGTQVLDTTPTDSATPAELQWKQYQQAISIPYTDYLLNSGGDSVVDLIMAKEEIAMGSLLQKLSRAIYGTTPQNTSIDIDPLTTAFGALGGTYANNTIATATGWACNGGAGPTTSANQTVTYATMQNQYGLATFGNEEPDTILCRQAQWNAFWNLTIANQRFQRDEETTRAGFKNHMMFNNAVVLHDSFVPANEMYYLTSKYILPVFHANDYFTVDPFLQPTNQRTLISHIWVTMNVQCLTLRNHSRQTNIT